VLHDGDQVQHKHDRAVTQDGCAADQFAGDHLAIQRFDDQFLLAHQGVHDEPVTALTEGDDHHEDAPAGIELGWRAAQAHQGEHGIAKLQHLVVVHAMDGALRSATDFYHCIQRNGVEAFLDAQQQ